MFHDLWSAKLPTITRRYTTRKAYKINGEMVFRKGIPCVYQR